MITLTDPAREKIRSALDRADPPRDALRIGVSENGLRFDYRLSATSLADVLNDDTVIEEDGFRLVLDADSALRLRGATLDYRESLVESGFKFDNPNEPKSPVLQSGARHDLVGPVSERIRQLLESEINPAIAAHGGRVSLVDVRNSKAYLAFGGGCHGCGLVDVTLKQGIEARILEVVPEIVEVVDTTDHTAGENPYY